MPEPARLTDSNPNIYSGFRVSQVFNANALLTHTLYKNYFDYLTFLMPREFSVRISFQ
jgi:hypothetical protein